MTPAALLLQLQANREAGKAIDRRDTATASLFPALDAAGDLDRGGRLHVEMRTDKRGRTEHRHVRWEELKEDLVHQGYVKAGSPAAFEALGGDEFAEPSCARCGARIKHVYLTNHGPLGGDCLATLTGDDSSRAAARRFVEKLDKAQDSAHRSKRALAVLTLSFDQHAGQIRADFQLTNGRPWYGAAGDARHAVMFHAAASQWAEARGLEVDEHLSGDESALAAAKRIARERRAELQARATSKAEQEVARIRSESIRRLDAVLAFLKAPQNYRRAPVDADWFFGPLKAQAADAIREQVGFRVRRFRNSRGDELTEVSARQQGRGPIVGMFPPDDYDDLIDRIQSAGFEVESQEAAKALPLDPPPQARRPQEHHHHGSVQVPGLPPVDVETPEGTVRQGKAKGGEPWAVLMPAHYGEFRGTLGVDGDAVDVFVGPERDALTAWVIRAKDPKTGRYDEDKVMVGFATRTEALRTFRASYNIRGVLGEVTGVPVARLGALLADAKHRGRPLNLHEANGHEPPPAGPDSSLDDAWRRLEYVRRQIAELADTHEGGKAIDRRDTNTMSMFDLMGQSADPSHGGRLHKETRTDATGRSEARWVETPAPTAHPGIEPTPPGDLVQIGERAPRARAATPTLPGQRAQGRLDGLGHEPSPAPTHPEPSLRDYDTILVNSSAGKDSQAMLDYVVEKARAEGVLDRVVVVHADLGRVEWEGTRELAEAQARHYGLRFEVVQKTKGDLIEQIDQRAVDLQQRSHDVATLAEAGVRTWGDLAGASAETLAGLIGQAQADGAQPAKERARKLKQAAERKLKVGKGAADAVDFGKEIAWPSSASRYCTSDHKRGPIRTLMTRLTDEIGRKGAPVRILNCMGLRADESSNRAKMPVFERDEGASNGKRQVDEWLPIHHWNEGDVWRRIRDAGTPYHRAYDLGMRRLSCVFCVFATRDDLKIAAHANPALFREYVALERRVGHKFRADLALAELADALAADDDRAEAAKAAAAAGPARWDLLEGAKGEPIANAPGLHLDPTSHRWTRDDQPAGHLFHSTSHAAMPQIAKAGLQPRSGEGLYGHGAYANHSQGKVFLSHHWQAAKEWHGKVGDQLEDQHGDGPLTKRVPVMLRATKRRTVVDPVGNEDVEGSRFTKQAIPPEDLEYWHPAKQAWRPVATWGDDTGHEHGVLRSENDADGYTLHYIRDQNDAGGFMPHSAAEANAEPTAETKRHRAGVAQARQDAETQAQQEAQERARRAEEERARLAAEHQRKQAADAEAEASWHQDPVKRRDTIGKFMRGEMRSPIPGRPYPVGKVPGFWQDRLKVDEAGNPHPGTDPILPPNEAGKAPHKDRLHGGPADEMEPGDFDPEDLEEGTEEETEHTDDRGIAQEIAMDHLADDPKHYREGGKAFLVAVGFRTATPPPD